MIIILLAAILLCLYMAWNIGSNDVANSMATAVGAKAITLRQAVIIAAVLNFVGAVFIGSHVTETVRKGIVDPLQIGDPRLIAIGGISSLLGAGLWVTFATWKSLPVSTTHSIIGSLIGFGLVAGGGKSIAWGKLGGVALSWVISPFFAGILAFSIFHLLSRFILRKEKPAMEMIKLSPLIISLTFLIISASLLFKTNLGNIVKSYTAGIIASVTLLSGGIGYFAVLKGVNKGWGVERIFRKLQIMTSCYVALSQGANDVANAIGPVAMVYSFFQKGQLLSKVTVPTWMLAIGGLGIGIGILTWGYRVMDTVGSKITSLTNTRGFTIDFSAATSILLASKLGMPISTTHAVIGAVVGIGLARGLEAVNMGVIRNIALSWLITIPAVVLTTIPIYLLILHVWR